MQNIALVFILCGTMLLHGGKEIRFDSFPLDIKLRSKMLNAGFKTKFAALEIIDSYLLVFEYYPQKHLIHVFDWNGNPVVRLMIDREIGSFAIDREKHRIIAFAVDSPFSFKEYSMPDILVKHEKSND